MLTWQGVVLAQIIVGSLMAVWMRHVSIGSRKDAFSVALITYACVATMGAIYSIVHNGGIPPVPEGKVWLYLLGEGLLIPAFWLCNFTLVLHIGATGGVISGTFHGLGVASLGVVFLGGSVTILFVIGALLILSGIYVSLTIRPDEMHVIDASMRTKIMLLISALTCFSFGIFFEKLAINAIGAWNYMLYGWTMQLVGASVLYMILANGNYSRYHAVCSRKQCY